MRISLLAWIEIEARESSPKESDMKSEILLFTTRPQIFTCFNHILRDFAALDKAFGHPN